MALAEGWSQSVGLPNWLVYFISGAFLGPFERLLTMIPSNVIVAKMIPQGVEASMLALSNVIIQLNQYLLRSQIALLINSTFINVTNKNLEDFVYLAWIEFLCAFIPFTFIAYLVPTI